MKKTRFLTHAVTMGVSVFVVFVAASFVGPGWYEELLHWAQPVPRSAPPPKPVARSGPIGPPVSITPMRPEGNDSSISALPQPLILTRTQRGRNSREGFAQIGVRAHSPQTYTAGALLANGARLTAIFDHYVVLERDGHTARLYLQGEVQPDARSAQSLLTVGGIPELTSTVHDSRDELTDYLRPNPVFAGNELHGYALYAGRKAAPFAQLGLRSGDLLTRINGAAVSDSPDSLSVLHTLIKGEALTVEIERQGFTQTLSLDGSILARAVSTETNTSLTQTQSSPAATTATRDAISSLTLSGLLTQGK